MRNCEPLLTGVCDTERFAVFLNPVRFAAGVAAAGIATGEAADGERPATRLERRVAKDILILIVQEYGG